MTIAVITILIIIIIITVIIIIILLHLRNRAERGPSEYGAQFDDTSGLKRVSNLWEFKEAELSFFFPKSKNKKINFSYPQEIEGSHKSD